MTDPTAAAAERLRRLANAKQAMPISDAANMVREFTNSFIAGDEPVKHQNTMELFQATLVLAGAWLDDHAADDAELIDDKWWRSICCVETLTIPIDDDLYIHWNRFSGTSLGTYCDRWELPHITTRGQLRLLLRALAQEPQP